MHVTAGSACGCRDARLRPVEPGLAGTLQAETREVSTDMGVAFARAHGCLFVETSAKGNVAVEQAFEELVHKVWCTRVCVRVL